MSAIEVKFDNKLDIENIYVPLANVPSSETAQENNNKSLEDQTKRDGVAAPLIRINNITVDAEQISYFDLKSTYFLPELTFTIKDNMDLITSVMQPSNDNKVYVQILPPFENAYKKINLPFYIQGMSVHKPFISFSCIYNVKELYNSRLESFGNISTYDMIEKIAKDSKLGLASNISGTDDSRYIYCNNISYERLIPNEVKKAGSDRVIIDSWIDWWNNINLVDIYERFNAIENNLEVWVTNTSLPNFDIDAITKAVKTDATITNSPAQKNSQLYSESYVSVGNTGMNIEKGTDRMCMTYNINNCEENDIFIEDGDTKNDIFTKYIYCGEVFGDYDYISQQERRDMFITKMNNMMIQVNLQSPVLGLMRGGRVNFAWYETNDVTQGYMNKNAESNIDMPEDENANTYNDMKLNKRLTGQYYINNTELIFENTGGFHWRYKLTLSRPADKITNE